MENKLYPLVWGLLKSRLSLGEQVVIAPDCPKELLALAADCDSKLLSYVNSSPAVALTYASGLAKKASHVWLLGQSSTALVANVDLWRSLICLDQLPLTLVAPAGLTGDSRGAVYQTLEDVAITRALRNVTTLIPDDLASLHHLGVLASTFKGPSYLRLSGGLPVQLSRVEGLSSDFWGGGRVAEGRDVTLLCCGIIVQEALKARQTLAQQGLSAEVIEVFSPTHLPEGAIIEAARRTGGFVVAEEAVPCGGLAEGVTALLSRTYPVPVVSVAVDEMGQCGASDELIEYYGLTSRRLVSEAVCVSNMRRH